MLRRILAAILIVLIPSSGFAQGGGGAACVWHDQVIVNSNNSYKLTAYSGQQSLIFVINSQCRLTLQYDANGGVSVTSRSVSLVGYRGQDTEAHIQVQNASGTSVVDDFVIAPPTNQGPMSMSGRVTSQPNTQTSTRMQLTPSRMTFTALSYEGAGFPQTQNLSGDMNAYQLFCDVSGGDGVILAGRWDRKNYPTTQLNVTTNDLPTTYMFNPNVSPSANPFPEQNLIGQALKLFGDRNANYRGYKFQLESFSPITGSRINRGNGYTAQLGFTKYQFQLHRQTPCPPQ